MSAELEEVVVNADGRDAEELLPDDGELALDLAARLFIRRSQIRARVWNDRRGAGVVAMFDPLAQPRAEIAGRDHDLAQRARGENPLERFDAFRRLHHELADGSA